MKHLLVLAVVAAALVVIPGCGSPDGRVADKGTIAAGLLARLRYQ